MTTMRTDIGVEYFAKLFDVELSELPAFLEELISSRNFDFGVLDADEQMSLCEEIEEFIASGDASVCGPERENIWEKCWKEQLEAFYRSGLDLDLLTPKFISRGNPVRFQQQFIKPNGADFEVDYIDVCRSMIFDKFFGGYSAIYEFGCGSGYNLVKIARLFPDVNIVGLDWSRSSNELVNAFAKHHKLNVRGVNFDLFEPNFELMLPSNSLVFTQTALEQLGEQYGAFIEYVFRCKPKLCVHIEPINELYDLNNRMDRLADDYLIRRNYLRNYYSEIVNLEKDGKAEIVEVKRMHSGGLYHESSLLVWKPIYQ